MKNWLKENWFKFLIIITMFISGNYYFIAVIKNQQIRVNIDNCRKIGEEYKKNEIKENPKLSFFAPKYTFNRDLDACIYSGGFMDISFKENNVTRYIKNLNTNEEIVGSTYIGKEKMFGAYNSEFFEKDRELFLNKY